MKGWKAVKELLCLNIYRVTLMGDPKIGNTTVVRVLASALALGCSSGLAVL